jgi:acetyl-CoA synthetase
VINVSGHRLGTAEIENAVNEHPWVLESAVVGFPHPIKGEGIFAFVICEATHATAGDITGEVRDSVSRMIGAIARPDEVRVVPGLPKTRSGKIMRRILRKVAKGDYEDFGDTSTLIDPDVVRQIVSVCRKGGVG